MTIRMAMVALAGAILAACPPTGSTDTTSSSSSTGGTNGGSTSSGGSSGGGTGSSSSSGGIKPEGAPCNATSECQSGLTCALGQCLEACTETGAQGSCDTGEVCAELQGGGGVCLEQLGRNEECTFNPFCEDGLECNPSLLTEDGTDVVVAVCHQMCAYNSSNTGCTGTDECLPSSANGLVEVQGGPDAGVTCNPDAGSACNAGEGYECLTLSNGNALCARPVASCGTAVPFANFQPLPDGGQRLIPEEEICNMGPDLGQAPNVLAGSRFCDTYEELANPPPTQCAVGIFGTQAEPYVGVCTGFCHFPAIPENVPGIAESLLGSAEENFDCPPNHFCDAANTIYAVRIGGTNAAQQITCTTDADCESAHSGSTCFDFSGGRRCGYAFSICQPGEAPTGGSSSSSGGMGSSGPAGSSSTMGGSSSSSGGTASSEMPASSSDMGTSSSDTGTGSSAAAGSSSDMGSASSN